MEQLRDGSTVADPRLGRIPRYDERSRAYQVRPLLEQVKAAGRRRLSSRPAPVTFDQSGPPCPGPGGDSGCVGFSFGTGLNSSPNRHDPPWSPGDCCVHYRLAQREDEWEGDAGTSLLALARIAHRVNLIGGYRWIGAGSQTPGEDLVETLDYVGGVWLGVPWYFSMFEPRPSGLLVVDPSSGLAGYHAIWTLGHRLAAIAGEGRAKVDHVVWQQTWGPAWGTRWYGVGGHAFVRTADVVDKLLPSAVFGEGCVPLEHAA